MRVTILGATGSVGASTLDLISRDPDRYEIVALTANRNVEAGHDGDEFICRGSWRSVMVGGSAGGEDNDSSDHPAHEPGVAVQEQAGTSDP